METTTEKAAAQNYEDALGSVLDGDHECATVIDRDGTTFVMVRIEVRAIGIGIEEAKSALFSKIYSKNLEILAGRKGS